MLEWTLNAYNFLIIETKTIKLFDLYARILRFDYHSISPSQPTFLRQLAGNNNKKQALGTRLDCQREKRETIILNFILRRNDRYNPSNYPPIPFLSCLCQFFFSFSVPSTTRYGEWSHSELTDKRLIMVELQPCTTSGQITFQGRKGWCLGI